MQILDQSWHLNVSVYDWLSPMFKANHVAADAVCGDSNMAADKNFTWSNEEIHLCI